MKLTLVAISSLTTASAFFTTPAPHTSSTKLFISSWESSRGPLSRWKKQEADPTKKISPYLKEPEPIAARSNLYGTVLVSGWVNTRERTDQTVFDFLNHEESVFKLTRLLPLPMIQHLPKSVSFHDLHDTRVSWINWTLSRQRVKELFLPSRNWRGSNPGSPMRMKT